MDCYNSYVQIDLDALKENMDSICAHSNTKIMLVVKADAYGHGAVQVAKHLEERCAFFGVAALSEALELRQNGIKTPILILGHTPVAAFPKAVELGIRPAIYNYEDAVAFSKEACRQGITAPFHFAVDTGMSRIGFQVTKEAADLCQKIADLPNLKAEGLFTHFSNADDEDQIRTENQRLQYNEFVEMLRIRGVDIPIKHIENSAALVNFSDHYDMVRAGLILYGMYPSEYVCKNNVPVKPVLSWYSTVTHVKTLEKGRTISYGATYTVTEPTVAATVSVGYADGYRRHLSNKGVVLIRGHKARILGRVCMDQIVVDVTDIPGVVPGDKVTLIGTDGEHAVTADQMADLIGTISYEITSCITKRVPRVYIKDGKTCCIADYI